MSQRQEHLDLLIEELERYGLRGEISDRGKHLEVAWNSPAGRRFVIVARTPSDWRAGLNTRSELRKLLRADNLQPKQISELSFQKAMSLPKQQVASPQLVLQNDVDALVELVFELQAQIVAISEQNQLLQDKMNSITVTSRIEFVNQEKAAEQDLFTEKTFAEIGEIPFMHGSIQYRICASLTSQFRPVKDIVEQSNAPIKYVYNTLNKAKNKGFAEQGAIRGTWRRK